MWQRSIVVLCLYMTCISIVPGSYGYFQDVAALCPYNDFCKTKATKVRGPDELHLVPCCQNCSCDTDCQLYGDCCPDVERTPGVEPKFPCVNLNTYFNVPRGLTEKEATHTVGYRVVDSCPNAELSLMYPRCDNHTDLEDYILITDKTTQRLYKNKHCALCNGVNISNFIEWGLITKCRPNMMKATSLVEWHAQLIASCYLVPYTTDPAVGQLARCPLRELKNIFGCHSSGKVGNFTEQVKRSCEANQTHVNNMYTFSRVVGVIDLEVSVYYHNVFCAACDLPSHQSLPGLCKLDNALNKYRTSRDFTTMINFKKQTKVDKEVRRCDPTQIWNPFNSSCMSVQCPFATYAYYGKCEDMYTTLPGEKYDIIFQLTYDPTIVFPFETMFEYLQNAVAGVFRNSECLECSSAILFDSKSNYFMRYSLNAEGSCTENYIISKTRLLLEAPPLKVRIGNITEVMLTPDIWDDSDILDQLDALIMSNTRYCSLRSIVVNWHKIFKCPRISVYSLGINETMAVTNEINGTICVDEYFRIMALLNRSQRVSPGLMVLQPLVLAAFSFGIRTYVH